MPIRLGSVRRTPLPHHADFGAAIFGPSTFVVAGRGGHFQAEANRLNAVPGDTLRNKTLAHGAGTSIAQAAIVLGRAAFIGEAGNDDFRRAALHGVCDFLDLAALRRANRLAVEVEINGRKLAALHIASKKRSAFASFGQRRSIDIVARDARALPPAFLAATGCSEQDPEEQDRQ